MPLFINPNGNKLSSFYLEIIFFSSIFESKPLLKLLITSLKISNYALIEHLDISFADGMTCITGETGAGKSILMGGLALVLGKRADMGTFKDKDKKCVVEAGFLIEKYQLEYLFEELELDYEPETILRREIVPGGKSRAFVNDSPVTLEVLSRLSEVLIDIHSQLENQSLFKSDYQFLVLDALAGNGELVKTYRNQLEQYHQIKKEYEQLQVLNTEAAKMMDYHQFLYDELQKADLTPDMMAPLEAEIDQLSNVDELQQLLAQSLQIVEEEQMGVMTQLATLNGLLKTAASKSSSMQPYLERITSLSIELKDIAQDIEAKQENLESNPALLEKLSQKWDSLQSLFHKHQVDSVAALIAVKQKLSSQLEETQNLDDKLNRLKDQELVLSKSLEDLARQLHQNREKAAPDLCRRLQDMMAKMGMQKARFEVKLKPVDQFLSTGKEQIDFLFSANLGSEFRPVKKVASGGEMSRIMLSIKAILSQYRQLPTIVFDEIDTGVSGAISNEIGIIMEEMAKNMQVFTITHLPQVAAKGKHHFKVYKEEREQTTLTRLKELNSEERIEELAHMLSGKALTQTALDHAKQLLN